MFPTFSKVLTATLLAGSIGISAQTPERFTPQDLQEDFRIAREALEEGHSGIYRYTRKAELDRRFEGAMKSLDRPMDALEFYRVLTPAVAAVRCGHTSALLSVQLKTDLEKALLLPLDVKVLEGRVFILRDFAQGGRLAGREIRSINGVPIFNILHTLLDAASGDGEIPTGRAFAVGRKFKEMLFTVMGMQGPFALGLGPTPPANPEKVQAAGQALSALRQASEQQFPQDQRSKRFAALTFEDEGRIARLKVFNFVDSEEDEDGASILKKTFETIQAKGSKTLILDLRNNGGGEDALGKLLLSYLVEAPFQYYENLLINRKTFGFSKYAEKEIVVPDRMVQARPDGRFNVVGHPNSGLQQANQPTFKGRVLVLINGGCFSTTSELLTQLHDRHRGTFIGEESGGGYYGNTSGSEAVLTLPHSKLRLAIPLMTYTLSVKGIHAPDRGVLPDHPIQPTIEDLLAGRDPEWERALALARKP